MSDDQILQDFPAAGTRISAPAWHTLLSGSETRQHPPLQPWVLLDEQSSESLLGQLQVSAVRCTFVTSAWAVGGRSGVAARDRLGCVLVTKDEDFHRLSVLKGARPKVVWLRVGNCATQ